MKDILLITTALEDKIVSQLQDVERLSGHTRIEPEASKSARVSQNDAQALRKILERVEAGDFSLAGKLSENRLHENGQEKRLKDLFSEINVEKNLIVWGIAIGLIGAVLPSLPVEPGSNASINAMLQQHQDGEVRAVVEKILSTESASHILDSSSGSLHRFAGHGASHDLIRHFSGHIAHSLGLPAPVLEVPLRILAHLLIDAAGSTGIPVPGSSYLIEFLSEHLGLATSPRWHSRLMGFRLSDLFATGSTSALLFLHTKLKKLKPIEEHIVAITAHGVATVAIAGVTATATSFGDIRLVANRSQVNYSSAVMLGKNCLQFERALLKERRQIAQNLTMVDSNINFFESRYPGE